MLDFIKSRCYNKDRKLRNEVQKMLKNEFKLTADYVGIDDNDEIFSLFYTLVEDGSFEKLGNELNRAGELEYSAENGYDPDEVEDWFFDNSEITEWGAVAKELYNPTISKKDIEVECTETRVAVVNGFKFTVSVTDSKDEMFRNKEAKKLLKNDGVAND